MSREACHRSLFPGPPDLAGSPVFGVHYTDPIPAEGISLILYLRTRQAQDVNRTVAVDGRYVLAFGSEEDLSDRTGQLPLTQLPLAGCGDPDNYLAVWARGS